MHTARPLRVVEVFHNYPPAIGGHERHVQDLAEGLLGRGFDARVVTSTLRRYAPGAGSRGRWLRDRIASLAGRSPRRAEESPFLDGPYALVNGVPVTRLAPRLPLRRRMELPGLRETLLELEPDLIHAHDIWCRPFEVSIEVARELAIPLFLSPVYHDRSTERRAKKWMRELRRVAARVPATATVLFNTPWEEQALERAGVRFQQTTLLPPSIDPDELERIPSAAVPGVPPGKRLISFVGRLDPLKGVDALIDAFAEAVRRLEAAAHPVAASVHLVIAGFRVSTVDYAALAAQRGLADRVTILADRPRRDIVNLLRASSIFALPSRCETFGIVVAEAWATGNLVLVNDHWALPYVVDHGHNGIVCGDGEWPDRLTEAILDIDTPRGRELVRNGEETVRRRYRRKDRIDYLARLVEEAIAPVSRSAS